MNDQQQLALSTLKTLFAKGRLRIQKVGESNVLQAFTLPSPTAPADWCAVAILTPAEADALGNQS